MVIILIGVIAIVFIFTYSCVIMDRQEIKMNQEAIQREAEILESVIKEGDRQRREEALKHINDVEV